MALKRKDKPIGRVIDNVSPGTLKQMPKHVKNSGGRNSPLLGDNGLMLEEGDNRKFMTINQELLYMDNIDLNNAEQVKERLREYFDLYAKFDVKPTVVGMAIALNGHNRQWLWGVAHDAPSNGKGVIETLPRDVTNLIKKAYFSLENSWETYMQNGKINPVAGIFLGKNNFAYKDQTEHIVTPNTGQDEINTEEIKQRYLSDKSDT